MRQLSLLSPETNRQLDSDTPIRNSSNVLDAADRAFHDWYRFVLSFPPHLVRDYLQDFGLNQGQVVLDPFCGTGTTVVEAKLAGLSAVGLEANLFPHFAGSVKIDWSIDPDVFISSATEIAERTLARLYAEGIEDNGTYTTLPSGVELRHLPDDAAKLLIANSISPIPLHKALTLRDCLAQHQNQPYFRHAWLALGKALVSSIGNLRFGPEVGVGKRKVDVPVVAKWLDEVKRMVTDLRSVADSSFPDVKILSEDARQIRQTLAPESIDAVITSPPYPNEKDYTRTTRLESVILGFYTNKRELRELKQRLVRSNTRGIYKADTDDEWINQFPQIHRLADTIEARRIELGKTSGFEKLYSRLTRLYFGGMARHFSELRSVLRPGAQLAYVVGDQASYFRVMIRTGQVLAEIAEDLGYEVVRIDLFRTRFSTATQSELREEVVVLKWPGWSKNDRVR